MELPSANQPSVFLHKESCIGTDTGFTFWTEHFLFLFIHQSHGNCRFQSWQNPRTSTVSSFFSLLEFNSHRRRCKTQLLLFRITFFRWWQLLLLSDEGHISSVQRMSNNSSQNKSFPVTEIREATLASKQFKMEADRLTWDIAEMYFVHIKCCKSD